tara:strand:+ start:145 stop:342 length:198 start_codon:yes stop_codon:yes gene_type:complete
LSEFKKFYDGDVGGFIDYCRDKMDQDSISLTQMDDFEIDITNTAYVSLNLLQSMRDGDSFDENFI